MKKLFYGVLLLLIGLTINVNAANYELRELIPEGIKTTIVTKNFSYQDFYYDNNSNKVIFTNIKNLSDNELPITISIALFDEEQRNLGIINHCSKMNKNETVLDVSLNSKEKKSYEIQLVEENVARGKSLKDIKYIAILSDNINCNKENSFDYVDQKIDDIGVLKKQEIGKDAELLIKIMIGLGVLLIVLFLYKFMFTNTYSNVDGDDVRDGYNKYNKKLQKEREIELLENPPVVEEKKPDKPIEILEQEEEAKKEDKDGTDLHNLYK